MIDSARKYHPVIIEALAEALHVQKKYQLSYKFWRLHYDLTNSNESEFKSAISLLSQKKSNEAAELIFRLEQKKYNPIELICIKAIDLWDKGDKIDSIQLLKNNVIVKDESGYYLNLLGVLFWRVKAREKAVEYFQRAVKYFDDPEAMVNLSFANRYVIKKNKVIRNLQKALLKKINLRNAFIMASNIFEEKEEHQLAKENRIRANLVTRPLDCLNSVSFQTISHKNICYLDGVLHIATTKISGNLTYLLPILNKRTLPEFFIANIGLDAYSDANVPFEVEHFSNDFKSNFPLNNRLLKIPENAWVKNSSGYELKVIVTGVIEPPLAHSNYDRIEINGKTSWIPHFHPFIDTKQNINISIKKSWKSFFSNKYLGERYPGFLAIPNPKYFNYKIDQLRSIDCYTTVEQINLRLACFMIAKGINLWEKILGVKLEYIPPIVVVDNGNSTFNYVENGFIRLTSKSLNINNIALLIHEAGHIFWGNNAKFQGESSWLAEALSEFTIYLAEIDGFIKNYSERSIQLTKAFFDGELPPTCLSNIVNKTDLKFSYLLRIKGCFFIKMLSKQMGTEYFYSFLKDLYNYGKSSLITPSIFFSLASMKYGASLNWFFNQWGYTKNKVRFELNEICISINRNSKKNNFLLEFELRCIGNVIIGKEVLLVIKGTNGRYKSVKSHIILGHFNHKVRLPFYPKKIIIDPNWDWYIDREEILVDEKHMLHAS